MAAGVYIHIPFCRSRCSYCDFATDIYRSDEVAERYVRTLNSEISAFGPPESGTPNVDTVYFGGGTPSLLRPEAIGKIIEAVGKQFSIDPNSEITMEMNPATVTAETLDGYRSLGINRASFGLQTFNDRDLRLLARGHTADDARQTFKLLRECGFENVSFDLIIGLPGQTIGEWERNLDEALKLDPEHLSLYLLEIHEGTPLAEQLRSGRRPMPDEELAASMYEIMQESVSRSGFEQYEISNFAKPGFASRHNSKYWLLEPVFGFGVSAHSFDGCERYANERDTNAYCSQIENSGTAEVMRETIDAAAESIFLGLRLTNGIDLADHRDRFGVDLLERYSDEIDRFRADGLIETGDKHIRLTKKGMLFSNEVFVAFV